MHNEFINLNIKSPNIFERRIYNIRFTRPLYEKSPSLNNKRRTFTFFIYFVILIQEYRQQFRK